MTRYDKTPAGWKDQNAVEPLEVEAEIFRNGEFAVRIVVSGEDRPGLSRDDCERIAGDIATSVGPRIVAALKSCVVE